MGETRTLLLIRHGETAQNVAGRWQGQSDTPLSDSGLRQVQRLKARFDAGIGYPIAGAFTSDLSRAHDTARIALGESSVPLVVTPLLRERSFGRWEGLTRDEVSAQFGDAEHPEGGERWDEVWERMWRALELVWTATPAGANTSCCEEARVSGARASLRRSWRRRTEPGRRSTTVRLTVRASVRDISTLRCVRSGHA